MKPVVLHCEADTAIAKHYKCERPELARDFSQSFQSMKNEIAQQPDRFSFIEKPVRRARIQGFPYKLIYEELEDCVQVIAVMHDGREPGYWKNRLS